MRGLAWWVSIGTAAGAALAAAGAGAQEKIVLRVADHYPVGAPTAQYTARHFIDTVRQKSGGRVDFEYFPAEQLGKAKDLLALTVSGVTDIGFVGPSYVSDKMPLSGVAELPGTFATSCSGTAAYWPMAKDGLLARNEFAPNGVRILLAVVLPPYQILTRGKLDTLADLKGLKLRSGGGAMDIAVRKLGAVPVRIAGPEVHEALTRGTLDGLVFPLAAVLQFNLQGPLKNATEGENFGGFAVTYVISERRWKQLPADVQSAMTEAGEATTRHACAMADRDNQPALEKLRGHGVRMVALSVADKAELKSLMAPVHKEWAAELDKRGRPGSQVLKEFIDRVR
jgi:TRAP-type C4-dicarboxylate transport system substrate-binding protein